MCADLAATLNGWEYRKPWPKDLIAQAKKSGLVIVTGASDDLVEFEGAIEDEFGASSELFVDGGGVIPSFDSLDKNNETELRAYFRREKRHSIKALWCAEPGYAWTYETTIPHATFDLLEDGDTWCRGFIFSLVDLQ